MSSLYGTVAIATIISFIASAIYYILLAKQRAKLSPAARASGRPKPTVMLLELVRTAIVASVLAYLIHQLGITTETAAAHLSLLLWLAFPVILLSGSVVYEKIPVGLAAIHAGDWAIKLLIITALLVHL